MGIVSTRQFTKEFIGKLERFLWHNDICLQEELHKQNLSIELNDFENHITIALYMDTL